MKKLLFGLSIALLAFSCGVFISNIFRAEPKPAFVPVAEQIKVEEVKNDEIPFFKIEQLEETEEIETIDNSKDINAWYGLDNNKKMPEVAMIKFYLTYYDDDGKKSDKPILYSGVFTTLGNDPYDGFAVSIRTSFENDRLKFRTKKFKGIEYRFEGIFYKNRMTGDNNEKLLRGTLRKFVKGKKVAELSGDFAFFEPYCLG